MGRVVRMVTGMSQILLAALAQACTCRKYGACSGVQYDHYPQHQSKTSRKGRNEDNTQRFPKEISKHYKFKLPTNDFSPEVYERHLERIMASGGASLKDY